MPAVATTSLKKVPTAELKRRKQRKQRKAEKLERRGDVQGAQRAKRRVGKINDELQRRIWTPRFIRGDEVGITPDNIFGPLGSIIAVTGHHTAGPKDTSDAHGVALFRQYDAAHRAKGWGGEGYHYGIFRSGTIIGLRRVGLKGAHTYLHNTGNVGIACHGTTGDQPTLAQERSLHWLLENAHTSKVPEPYRAPRNLARVPRRGHNDWPDNPTACPATHKPMFLRGGRP